MASVAVALIQPPKPSHQSTLHQIMLQPNETVYLDIETTGVLVVGSRLTGYKEFIWDYNDMRAVGQPLRTHRE